MHKWDVTIIIFFTNHFFIHDSSFTTIFEQYLLLEYIKNFDQESNDTMNLKSLNEKVHFFNNVVNLL